MPKIPTEISEKYLQDFMHVNNNVVEFQTKMLAVEIAMI